MLSPLFRIVPVDWQAPAAADYDALFLTSANAPRHAGPQLEQFRHLRCYAVGEATAAAASAAKLHDVRTGDSDGKALLDMAVDQGAQRLLHLCGRDHIPLDHPALTIERRIVYVAEPLPALPPVPPGAVALLHSPRAAAHFAELAGRDRSNIRIAAISAAAAAQAGKGWSEVRVADAPRDEALLELAAGLCKSERRETGNDE